jgi:hypothetical protein
MFAGALFACLVVPTGVGGNATRLAALAGGPLVACVWAPRRPMLLLAFAVPFVYWQAMPPVRDLVVAAGDPSTHASYYAPLIERLRAESGSGPMRVEVPFTRVHWEAAHLAEHVAIARGWERQLDRKRNAVFYEGELTPARYTAWLHENAIAFVALPDVAFDYSARAEAALVRRGMPALHEVWRSAHWRLFRVAGATPIGATRVDTDGFEVAGSGDVRIRFSPHWAVVAGSGCVSEAPGGFTRVRATAEGPLRIATRVDPLRALLRRSGERCADNRTGKSLSAG